MQKSDIRILIVEDDSSLGPAIETALQRAGYSTFLAPSYSAAKSAFSLNDYRGLIIDCMLPQKSGVDLAQELQQESPKGLFCVLTSGIFKNKPFAHDAKLRGKAQHFLTKPFDIGELVKIFDDAFSADVDAVRAPLFQLMQTPKIAPKDRVSAVKATDFIHGFDLPYVYSLLMDQHFCGELEIHYDENTKSTIGFHSGRIDKVMHFDSESYFGTLVVEKGYATFEEVEENLQLSDSRPIGQKLVDNSILSPHAIQVVQKEQMVIRISKTIQDTSVKIQLNEMQKPEPGVFIDSFEFTQLMSDWLSSKLSTAWLKSFYTQWHESALAKGEDYSKLALVQVLPVVKPIAGLLKNKWPPTVQDFLIAYPMQEEQILRAIHFLLLQRVMVFAPKDKGTTNFDGKIQKLKKIWDSMQGQNHFEVFGLNTKSRPSEINRAYLHLAKSLHPDKLEQNAPEELKELAHRVFSRITDAHQTIENDKRRSDYIKTLELGQADEILKAESAFDEAYLRLTKGRFREARKMFEKVLRTRGARSDTMIFLVWALIREKKAGSDPLKLGDKVGSLLQQVPHEDRHSPPYFFVRGLYYGLLGDVKQSYSHLRHAVTLEPGFGEARKEMAMLKSQYGRQKTNLLTDDLSQVVTNFFKKKSG
jgi:CheY-like chemotaxis protein